MREQLTRAIQKEGAEALLDRGVSLPLKDIRLPFRRTPLKFRVTMRRPTLGGQIRIAELYLSLDTTAAALRRLDTDGQMRFISEHGRTVSRMVAVTLCRGPLRRKFLEGPVAWFLRHFVSHTYMLAAMTHFVLLMGTEPFTNIIRSAEIVNPMKARLSH